MNNLLKFFKSKGWESKRAWRRHGDPAKGIEYNEISTVYLVSKRIYAADIARTPQVVKGRDADSDYFLRIDVHAEAYRANSKNHMVDYYQSRVKGRGR